MAVRASRPNIVGIFMAATASIGADIVGRAVTRSAKVLYGIHHLQGVAALAVLLQVVLALQFERIILPFLGDGMIRFLVLRRLVLGAHFHELIFEIEVWAVSVDAEDADVFAFGAETEDIIADAALMVHGVRMGRRLVLFGQGEDNRKLGKGFGAIQRFLLPGRIAVVEQNG